MFTKKNSFRLSFVIGVLALITIISFTGFVSAEDTQDAISAEITMDADDLTAMNASADGATDLYTATIIIDGTTYENVGIRLASQSDVMEQMQENSDGQQPQGQGGDGSGQQPPQGQGGQQPADGSSTSEKPEGEEMVSYLIQLDYTTSSLAYNEKTTIILSQMGNGMGTGGQGGEGEQSGQQAPEMPEGQGGQQQPERQTNTRINLTINGTDAGEFTLM